MISFSATGFAWKPFGYAGGMRRAGRRAVVRPEHRVAGVVHAILERHVRREVLAVQHVRRVHGVHDVAERRETLDPQLQVVARDELTVAEREHHVLHAAPADRTAAADRPCVACVVVEAIRAAVRRIARAREIGGAVGRMFVRSNAARAIASSAEVTFAARALTAAAAALDREALEAAPGKNCPDTVITSFVGVDCRGRVGVEHFLAFDTLNEVHRFQVTDTER